MPDELGFVSDVRALPQPDRSVVLIKDAHVNYEGQKHLAAILDRLVSQHGLRLVLVEGSEGDVSLGELRTYGTQAARTQVAEKHLKSGMISGEEYLNLVSDHPLTLWGIDDPKRYEAHYQVFLEADASREGLGRDLAAVRQLATALQPKMLNDRLQAQLANRAAFDAKQRSLAEHLRDLAGQAKAHGLAMDDCPNVSRFLESMELETGLNLEAAGTQQAPVIERLQELAESYELERLAELSKRLRSGAAAIESFYEQLDLLVQRHHVDLAAAPDLGRYLRYVRLKSALDSKRLLTEITKLEDAVTDRLIANEDERRLLEAIRGVDLAARLVRLAWTPDDYQAASDHPDRLRVSRWLPPLRVWAKQYGVAFDWEGNLAQIERRLAAARQFYELAGSRDAEMIERALEKMRADGERVAALVAGGYHANRLRDLLVERGVAVAVVTPLASAEEADPGRYARILKAKHDLAAAQGKAGSVNSSPVALAVGEPR